MNKYKLMNILSLTFAYILLVMFSISIILPVLWIVMSSFQPGDSLFTTSFVPDFRNLTIRHYIALFDTRYPIWFMNSLKVAVINMVLAVTITSLTAYGFSRFKFKGKRITMVSILVLQMFPSFLAMVAIYILLNMLGLLNSHAGLLLVYVSGQIPYNTWLVKGFLDGIPKTLDEAARVDGANDFVIFYRIIMPLAKPVLVLVAITNFMAPWFDFIFPRIILRSPEKYTLAIGIFRWVQENVGDRFTQFAAGAILVAVPITILFAYLQKHIAEGLSAGAVKG